MSQATLERLWQLAESISTAERKVSPMQVAAPLLEDSLNRVLTIAVYRAPSVGKSAVPGCS